MYFVSSVLLHLNNLRIVERVYMIKIIDYNLKPEYKDILTAEQLDVIRPYKDLTYLDTIVNKLIEVYKLDLTGEQKSNLKTYVYLASGQFRQEVKDKATQELIAQGWKPLTSEIAKTFNGKKIQIWAKKEVDWFTSKINDTYKVLVTSEGYVYLMKPRATRRGLALAGLDNPMYKTV